MQTFAYVIRRLGDETQLHLRRVFGERIFKLRLGMGLLHLWPCGSSESFKLEAIFNFKFLS